MARLSASYTQSCRNCYQEFIPKKRGTQLHCSASCRTTYCRKKKAGTLGRLTKLPGPQQRVGLENPSFAKAALTSAAGALAANAVSQTAEYFAITQGLERKVDKLLKMVDYLIQFQSSSNKLLGKGLLKSLRAMGIPETAAREAMGLSTLPASSSSNELLPTTPAQMEIIRHEQLVEQVPKSAAHSR